MEVLNNIKILYDGEYKKINNEIYFAMVENRQKETKNWWAIYNKERSKSLSEFVILRKKAFDIPRLEQQPDGSFSEVIFWKNLPEEMKNEIANDIDQRYLYKLNIGNVLYKKYQKVVHFDINYINSTTIKDISASLSLFQKDTPFENFNFNIVSVQASQDSVSISVSDKKDIIATGLQMYFGDSEKDDKRKQQLYSLIQLDHKNLIHSFDKKDKITKNITDLINSSKKKFWDSNDDISEAGDANTVAYSRNNVLDLLSENPKFEYISDVYYQPESLLTEKEKMNITVNNPEQIINKYKSVWDVSVKSDQNVFLIRNNKWYRDDFLMPDIDICNNLVRIYNEENENLKDEITEWDKKLIIECGKALKKHTLYQISNGIFNYMPPKMTKSKLFPQENVFPLSQIADFILSKYELLDFISSLNGVGLDEFFSNGIIYGQLTNIQKEKLRKLDLYFMPVDTSVLRLEVVPKIQSIGFNSKNAGILPRLLKVDYVVKEIVR
jgi:hypothetical protein